MKLLHDYILVPKEEKTEETVGGIILASKVSEQRTGVVKAVGEGRFDYGKWIHNDVEVGDTVQFKAGAGIDISIQGKEYLLLRNPDIICILNKE